MLRSLAVAVVVLCALVPTRRADATTIDFSSNTRCGGTAQGGFFEFSINTLAGDTFTVDGVARPGAITMGGAAPLYVIGVPTTATSFVTTDSGSIQTVFLGFSDTFRSFNGTLIATGFSPSHGTPIFPLGSVLNYDVRFFGPSGSCVPVSGEIASASGGTPSPIPEPAPAALLALGLTSLGAFIRRRA